MTIPAFGLGTFRLKDGVVIASVKTALELATVLSTLRKSMIMKRLLDRRLLRAAYHVASCISPPRSGLKTLAKTS